MPKAAPYSPERFAHPIEKAFAHILDFYTIEWVYEPRTFALDWDREGNVLEAFSPDFYLPGQDLYLELTTLRPRLSNRKNWKIRRMYELYPDIKIKLLKRRELHHLMVKFGLHEEAERIRGTEAQEG